MPYTGDKATAMPSFGRNLLYSGFQLLDSNLLDDEKLLDNDRAVKWFLAFFLIFF